MSYQKALTKNKKMILYLSIIFVIGYFLFRLATTGTFEIGFVDWGIDMGYTQLMWAFGLVLVCLGLLIYFKQNHIRTPLLNRTVVVLLSSSIFFVLMGFLFFQFLSHDPNIDFYHRFNFFEGNLDKAMHLLFTLFLTIIALKISPKRSTLLLVIVLVWLMTLTYELFEIQSIYCLSDRPYEDWLFPEIADVIPDMLFNSMGVVIGFLLMRNKIRMKE